MNELIVFKVADEFYGVDATKVREIQTYEQPTSLPNTKAFVKGIINIRGEIVPVIDLHLRFDADAKREYHDKTPVITTKTMDNRMIAIIVDTIETLEMYSPEMIVELNNEVMFINRNFLKGFIQVDGKHIVIIDVDKMFASKEIETY